MNPLIVTQVFIGAACLAIGTLHLAVARRRSKPGVHVWFALAAIFAAGNALAEAAAYQSVTVAGYNRAFKVEILFQGLSWIALVWYVSHYAGTSRRWLGLVVTAGFTLALVVHLLSPYGVLYQSIDQVVRFRLPWGETYSLATGPANRWRILSDTTTLLFIAYVLDAWIGLVRTGQRRRAIRLGIAMALILIALVHGSLVDLGVIQTPYILSIGFLLTVWIMGLDLTDDAVRAAELAHQVTRQEEQWSTLLEGVHMLVVSLNADGRLTYANPFFGETMGTEGSAVRGREFRDFLHPAEVPRVTEAFSHTGSESTERYTEARMKTAGGEERVVLWSTVPMRDGAGDPVGILIVGADVTERRVAEASRDEALREVRILQKRLEEENVYLKEEIRLERDFTNIVGRSDALQYVLHRIEQVAETDTTVLIEGETGAGKELVARAIHEGSARSEAPFVKVNCAALPPNLVESELFGHEPGAFTGAVRLRKGRFELAHTGTILLDEVGELPLDIQAKLLRVLQEGEYERVGSSTTSKVDVRLVASTNKNLRDEVDAGRFREDLYYRLHVYPVTVPPLRERRDDIPLLAEHFVTRMATRAGKVISEIPGPVMSELKQYDWPGNIRELQNVLERAVITTRGTSLTLPERLVAGAATTRNGMRRPEFGLRSLEDMEKHHIRSVLDAADGRVGGPGGAAEILRLHPNTLRSRMKKLGISGPKASATTAATGPT